MGIAAVVALSGCKRGEDDPMLSLQSRDARVTGEWKLVGMDAEFLSHDLLSDSYWGDSSDRKMEFDYALEDGILTVTGHYDDGNQYESFESTERYAYEVELVIEKGGRYTYKERLELISSKATFWQYDYENDQYEKVTIDSDEQDMLSEVSYDGYWHWKDNDRSKALLSLDMLGDQYLLELRNSTMVWEYVGNMSMELEEDAFFVRSSRNRASIAWQPLTRDGGARLHRRYRLYDLTEERDLGRYWEDYDQSWD